jgi:hypothetical protein
MSSDCEFKDAIIPNDAAAGFRSGSTDSYIVTQDETNLIALPRGHLEGFQCLSAELDLLLFSGPRGWDSAR